MISFFRKIRKNLLNKGKTARYFKYAIGEILLVVIGILIALQINNWNTLRNEQSKIKILETSLAEQMTKNQHLLELQQQKEKLEQVYLQQHKEVATEEVPMASKEVEITVPLEEPPSLEKTDDVIHENSKPREIPKQLGKVFEVSNESLWEVKSELYKNQKFKLTELLALYKNFRVEAETFVRKEGKWWKKVKEVPELNMDLITYEEDGEERCFIERKSVNLRTANHVVFGFLF